MIKRSLFFGNPARLSLRLQQLVVERPNLPTATVPIEDVGVVVLEHPQITISHPLLGALLEAGAVLITSDTKFHPAGLLWPLGGHFRQGARLRAQWHAPRPLHKQLWKAVVQAKLRNQAALLAELALPGPEALLQLAAEVRSGDPENLEARAAARYWKTLFAPTAPWPTPPLGFVRRRDGPAPNAWFNYAYAILRAATARAIAAAGLHPGIGIHHHNQYNAFPLADDLMEPYRPMADRIVLSHWANTDHKWTPPADTPEFADPLDAEPHPEEPLLKTSDKAAMLALLTVPAALQAEAETGPLMTMLDRTATSLAHAYEHTDAALLRLPRLQPSP